MSVKLWLKSHKLKAPVFFGYLTMLMLLLSSQFVHAQSFQSLTYDPSQKGFYQGEVLEARWDSFVSSPSNMVQSDQDLIFYGHSFHENTLDTHTYLWDIGGRYSKLENFQFWVKQAYLSKSFSLFSKPLQVSFGRRYFSNLKLDSVWNLGVLESQFRGDPTNPIRQGLTGLFFNYQANSQLKLKFFASALSFPDMGTNFDVKDGQVNSESPWFVSAPSYVSLNGKQVPLTYDLNISNQYEKLFAFSGLFAAEWSSPDLDVHLNLGVSPSKQWALNIEPKGMVDSDDNQSQVQVGVNPQLLSRFVGSLSLSKRLNQGLSLSAEYFTESYNGNLLKQASQDDMQSSVTESSFVHVGINKKSFLFSKVLPAQFSLYYLKRVDARNLKTQDDFSYGGYSFVDAVSLQMTTEYAPLKMLFQFKSFYDLTKDSVLFSPRIEMQAKDNLNIYSRFDLIGASGQSGRGSYLANQRSNDRFILGIKYAM